MQGREKISTNWDLETDIVIVGFGLAGGISAIEATDLGLETLILEKMPMPGGISICSGGGVRVASNLETAFSYLKATCGGTTPDTVLRAFAKGLTEIQSYMEKLANVNQAVVNNIFYPGNYPFPGYRDLGFFEFKSIPGFDDGIYYPQARGLRGGKRHFKVIEDNIKKREVRVMTETAVRHLITRDNHQVIGVAATYRGQERTVKARKGVILACGGFEADEGMKRQFIANVPILSAAFLGNTGDGIRMAQKVGAALWHMNTIHGSYGFRHSNPNYPFGLRTARLTDWSPVIPINRNGRMCWILIDQKGRRYMNEYPPYLQDTGHLGMLYLDTVSQNYPRVPSYLVFDEEGRKCYPLSIPTFNDPVIAYDWSEDNLKEVESGILVKAATVEDLALKMGVPPVELKETLTAWNKACEKKADKDFGRLPETMMPITTPPFYYGQVWPIVSNTQGGPVHNEHWQILDAFGDPIPGLYEAGECGGIWGHLYLAAGNLAECYIGGWTAARHIAGS
jgi:succinate dehydrogenase/fumarate reductase flavoprotein subunit